DKLTYAAAMTYCDNLTLAGDTDWRLPDIQTLYSLIEFSGTDPSGCDSLPSCPDIIPFLNIDCFDFEYGDTGAGERLIDAQYWSSTEYVSTTMNGDATVFGVNFADGRIKGYPRDRGPRGGAAEPAAEELQVGGDLERAGESGAALVRGGDQSGVGQAAGQHPVAPGKAQGAAAPGPSDLGGALAEYALGDLECGAGIVVQRERQPVGDLERIGPDASHLAYQVLGAAWGNSARAAADGVQARPGDNIRRLGGLGALGGQGVGAKAKLATGDLHISVSEHSGGHTGGQKEGRRGSVVEAYDRKILARARAAAPAGAHVKPGRAIDMTRQGDDDVRTITGVGQGQPAPAGRHQPSWPRAQGGDDERAGYCALWAPHRDADARGRA
ncbi:MAG: DUF1566 domain-containing protein, partial [Chloroflexales bacterium]|nr:DUF1566 domain-containing protein [Chloroflexales bacterium]